MKNILVISIAAASALLAQETAPAPPSNEFFRVEAGRVQHLSVAPTTMAFVSGMNVGPTTTGAPYSAEAVNETVQTLYDGNRIVQKTSTKQYRDSEGRERHEEGSPMNAVFITDPVAKVSYTLYPDTKTASKTDGPGKFFFQSFNGAAGTAVAAPALATRRIVSERIVGTSLPYTAGFPPNLTVTVGPEPGAGKVEDLGTKMLEGVQAQGTRATTVIPAGQIGNDRDIEVVDERWYSPELKLTVMTSHSDPRSGQTTYKLTNIQRIEQVKSLFEIPSNYTIQENSGNVFFTQPIPVPAKKEE